MHDIVYTQYLFCMHNFSPLYTVLFNTVGKFMNMHHVSYIQGVFYIHNFNVNWQLTTAVT